jgi:hypothetical protein
MFSMFEVNNSAFDFAVPRDGSFFNAASLPLLLGL